MNASPAAMTDARSRILDAAAEAFMRSGFAGTTIDDIARDVSATKGLVYYHFRSKFDIFLAVYGEGMRRVRERVEPHIAARPGVTFVTVHLTPQTLPRQAYVPSRYGRS